MAIAHPVNIIEFFFNILPVNFYAKDNRISSYLPIIQKDDFLFIAKNHPFGRLTSLSISLNFVI